MRPAAVLLDFDGVIVDSTDAHLDAWCDAVKEVFRCPLPEAGSLRGYATRTIAQILCRRFGDQSLVPVLIAAKERCLVQRFGDVPLLPGAAAFFDALKKAQLPYGVASNSTSAFVRAALAHHGLAAPAVITATEISRAKPAPDIFWACANELKVPTSQRTHVTIYEDSRHGLKAARAAGMMPLGVCSAHSAAELRAAGAVAVCDNLAHALTMGWLEQMPGRA